MKAPPPLLYRYLDAAGAWKSLEEATLKFCALSLLNDPFDTNIAVAYEFDEEDSRMLYRKLPTPTNWSSENQFVEEIRRRPTMGQKILERTRDCFVEFQGIACFTENSNDPLMWAHYADKHQGVVIGFHSAHADFSQVRRVEYETTRPLHRRLCDKLEGKQMIKSEIWKPVQEWRLSAELKHCQVRMVGSQPIYVQTLSRDSFASVTFGCRTPSNFKTAVALSLKRWNLTKCELQEVELCNLTYELTLKPFTL